MEDKKKVEISTLKEVEIPRNKKYGIMPKPAWKKIEKVYLYLKMIAVIAVVIATLVEVAFILNLNNSLYTVTNHTTMLESGIQSSVNNLTTSTQTNERLLIQNITKQVLSNLSIQIYGNVENLSLHEYNKNNATNPCQIHINDSKICINNQTTKTNFTVSQSTGKINVTIRK